MRIVYIVGDDPQTEGMYTSRGWEVTEDVYEADLVHFLGGTDVNPMLYGEVPHPSTESPDTERDADEYNLFNELAEMGMPMVGVCRGGQFLNVMSGGSMWQNVDYHLSNHLAYVIGDLVPVFVTSDHHQMMRPSDSAVVLMTAKQSTTREHMKDGVRTVYGKTRFEDDVEACYYPSTNSLCFQPHPEYFSARHELVDVFFNFIETYLFDDSVPWDE